jgi:hypothetical protein
MINTIDYIHQRIESQDIKGDLNNPEIMKLSEQIDKWRTSQYYYPSIRDFYQVKIDMILSEIIQYLCLKKKS